MHEAAHAADYQELGNFDLVVEEFDQLSRSEIVSKVQSTMNDY